MHLFKKYVLDNGLRVILAPQPQSSASTVLVLVEAGSKYETKKISGASHFLEHMCFKGTEKRPSALAISSELESLGAINNAFTSHEATGYWAKVHSAKLDNILEIIADLYLNPIFDEKEMEKEKGVIIEELNMYEDTPMRKVGDLFMNVLYGDQPAGWEVGGTKETVCSFKKEDILKYRGRHYVASATAVAIAGNFDEKKILKRIENLFNRMPANKKFSKEKTNDSQKKPAILVKYKESDQTHIVLGFRAFNMYDKRRYALSVLGDILGGGMSSRLFQRIREQMGAAYYVRAGADLFTDHGLFAVSAGLDHTKVNQVISAILDEFKKIVLKSVSPEELQKSKNHIVGQLMIGLETSDEVAGFYGNQEIFHQKIITPEQLVKKIEAVTPNDILKLAKDIVKNQGLNLAIIGPFKEKGRFEKILKIS
jgi:predicted Zn-dependent peptidase